MTNSNLGRKAITREPIGTFDFANPVEVLKEVDRGMREYFGAEDWLATRRKLFPGLKR